jgi:hypothetical protein
MGSIIKDVVTPAASVLAAILAAWVNYTVSEEKSRTEATQAEVQKQLADISTLVQERGIKKVDEDLEFQVYSAVTNALKTNDAKQQQAASALVIAMLREPLRTDLLHVFVQSQTTAPQVRDHVDKVLNEEQMFKTEDATVAESSASKKHESSAAAAGAVTPSSSSASIWGDYDFDIFWCEHSGEAAQHQAEAIVAALKAAGARGRLRSRLLPDTINAQPGYRIDGYSIRRHGGDAAQAQALQAVAQKIVPDSNFEIVLSGQPFRWYLSAFVCSSGG